MGQNRSNTKRGWLGPVEVRRYRSVRSRHAGILWIGLFHQCPLGIEGVDRLSSDQIIRSVSLSVETDAIRAKRVPNNFSRFVRDQLKELEAERRDTHINVIGEGFLRFCNPFHAKGLCRMCWPDGPPMRVDWLEYVRLSAYNRSIGKPIEALDQPEPASIHAESIGAHKPKQEGRHKGALILSWLDWVLLAISTL